MKTLFIEVKKKSFENINIDFSRLPGKIGLLYTIQYSPLFEKIKMQMEKAGKKVFIGKSSLQPGQIIGCNLSNALEIEKNIDCFVLLTSGKWHGISLALSTDKPIYIIEEGNLRQISPEEIEILKKKRKAALSKFILAEKIGIIVSTKPGQNRLSDALKIKNELIKKNKEVFLFISDCISKNELENFKIDSWLNTACPGIVFDIPNIINLFEYQSIEKLK